jgi:hypothetical protein
MFSEHLVAIALDLTSKAIDTALFAAAFSSTLAGT